MKTEEGVQRREFLKRASIVAASTPLVLSVTAGTASANHSAGHEATETCSAADECNFPNPCCCTSGAFENRCTSSTLCQTGGGACMH